MNNLHDDEQDRLHYNRGERYVKNIENLYKSVINQISQLPFLEKVDKNKPFKISDYPTLKKSLDRLFLELAKNISFQISSNSQTEWRFAEKKMVDLAKRHSNNPKYRTENLEALNAFLNRKDGGLNLSDRVWNYTKQFKNEIELGLDLGIGEGKSAAQIARELKSYLKDPDALFRRVRDKHGNLHLSKNAENYHPGQGVYRSSYKNAERLARTETNMAYHEAIFEKYQQFDFVIGIEVRLSNNPNHCPFCAAMAGKYPKDFKFTGWHPNCRCTTIPILKPLEETEIEPKAVTELHKPFEEWIEKNKNKIQTTPKQPYFIQNNRRYVDKVLKGNYEILHKNSIFEGNLAQIKNKVNLPNIDIEKINAINIYTGNYYRDINRYLRGQTHTIDENIGLTKDYYKTLVETINGGLDDLPKYKGTAYRATTLSKEVLGQYKSAFESGKPYTEKAFFSTSYDKEILKHSYYEGNVEFFITSKRGVNIEKISKAENEKEVLFKAGTKFKVLDITTFLGDYKITLEEL